MGVWVEGAYFLITTFYITYYFTVVGKKASTSCFKITPWGPEPFPIYYIFIPLLLARTFATGLIKVLPESVD